MPIDITTETLLSLTEATKALPTVNGKRHAIPTLWRWCRRGVRGVRLEYVRMGRNIATSQAALNRFFNALAAADVPPTSPTSPSKGPRAATSPQRRRQLEEADRILDRAKI